MKAITVTPQQYDAFLAKMKTERDVLLETTPTGGKLSHHGTVISWTYANGSLAPTVVSKPLFTTESSLEQWIDEQFVAAPKAPALAAKPDWKAQLGLKG